MPEPVPDRERPGLPEPAAGAEAGASGDGGESTTFVVRQRQRPDEPAIENPCLVTIHGPNLGRKVEIDRDEFTIGRGDSNDLAVPVGDVSRVHCRITRLGGALSVCDLDSTNGTYVNDDLATPGVEFPLRPGDHLNLGGAIFKLLEGGHPESAYHEELYRTAIIDGLTQIYNRRYLSEFFERELSRAQRHQRPLSLLLLDVDEFKRINDERGHLCGDQILRELAALLGRQMRRECCFARYGGEEFAVVLPETDAEGARLAAERMRGLVEAHGFRADGRTIPVTVSIGIATLEPGMQSPAQLFHCADLRLYEAKHAGRNCVVG
jgi:diguanylate cyclase (GGDEF)-like protein